MDNIFDFIRICPHSTAIIDKNQHLLAASKKTYAIFGLPTLLANRKRIELENRFRQEEELHGRLEKVLIKLKHSSSTITIPWQHNKKIYDLGIFSCKWQGERLFCINFDDVTYKYKQGSPYELSRQYLEKILNNLPVGVTVIDNYQHIFVANNTQLEFLARMEPSTDIDLAQVIGFKVCDIFPDCSETSWEDIVETVLTQDNPSGLQFVDTYSNSVFQYTVAPFVNESNQTPGAIIISEDITEKAAMEQELKQAEEQATRLQALEEINVALRHEIYNVITPISMNAELIKHSLAGEMPEEEEMAESIINEAKRLHSFIEKLSNMNQISTVSYLEGEDEQMLNFDDEL